MVQLVWYNRDLRVHDHAPLAAAAAAGSALALYVLEPELWAEPEMSGRHFAFLCETLTELDAALRARGGRLVVRVGEAVAVFADLHARYGLDAIHAHEETGLLWTYARDRAVRAWARRAGVPLLERRQHGVWRAHGNRDGWARRWGAQMASPVVPAPGQLLGPDAPSDPWPDAAALGLAPDPCPERQPGGRRAAVALLRTFLAERGREYRAAMASPLAGASACSRLSAHLALGAVSMRETFQAAARAHERWTAAGEAGFARSIASFQSRLHWHCHFIQKLEDEPEMQRRTLHPAYEGLRPIGPDHAAVVAAWAAGRTGFPFVDACMRSLAGTGWLNFRMRAMVTAFASQHLWQDWRLPAQALARLFTDFEPGIHYPQVQMQSGVTGVNTARIYNPVKQSQDQDPDGVFIRRWVPELAALPTAWLHEPWTAPEEALAAAGVALGTTYPARLVDHVAAGAAARERIYAVRQGPAFAAAAAAIQDKHGSRKAGLPTTERRRPRPKPPRTRAPDPQARFEF